jgi:hypothetical protein
VRPKLNAKHKIQALKRRKALLDALIAFVRKHPNICSEAVLRPLYSGVGLYFYDTAIMRPLWVKDKIVLRLEKYREDWADREAIYYARLVCEDVSKMPEKNLDKILDQLYAELHADDDDDE